MILSHFFLNEGLNHIYTSGENSPPNEHILDSFNLDTGELLSRMDFLSDINRFPEIASGGIDISDNKAF